MNSRVLGSSGIRVSQIGYGCMGLSWAYGTAMKAPDERAATSVLHAAIDMGIAFFDTADMYGPFTNEQLVGRAIADRRERVVIATKCGLVVAGDRTDYDLQRNATPEHIRKACDASLERLGVDVIDLYQLHRVDPNVPVEESVGAMADLVEAGKVRAIGLSEVDVPTLERAMRTHPIATLQSEYSLFERNLEAQLLEWCRSNDVAVLPYSPLGRGMLTGRLKPSDIAQSDFRSTLPRYQADAFEHNRRIVERIVRVAARTGATAGQIALAWLLAKGEHIIPIPGTTRIEHLRENVATAKIRLTPEDIAELDALPPPMGDRYPPPKATAR